MIKELGGESNVTLTEDVTHLLARSEGSEKYRVSKGHFLIISDDGGYTTDGS